MVLFLQNQIPFLGTNSSLRTDESIYKQFDDEYHKAIKGLLITEITN